MSQKPIIQSPAKLTIFSKSLKGSSLLMFFTDNALRVSNAYIIDNESEYDDSLKVVKTYYRVKLYGDSLNAKLFDTYLEARRYLTKLSKQTNGLES
jgi:cellulose biosynthesis protein BcsQ